MTLSNEMYEDDYSEESTADSVCDDSGYMDKFPSGFSQTMPWWGDEILAELW